MSSPRYNGLARIIPTDASDNRFYQEAGDDALGDPMDYLGLWVKQQDLIPGERERDMTAFDKMPITIRNLVNEYPIRLAAKTVAASLKHCGVERTRDSLIETAAIFLSPKNTR